MGNSEVGGIRLCNAVPSTTPPSLASFMSYGVAHSKGWWLTLKCARRPVSCVLLQVGHNALGAGQIIDQGARLVDKAVQVHTHPGAELSLWQISNIIAVDSPFRSTKLPPDLCCPVPLQSGDIFKHDGWKKLMPAFKDHTLHFIGLLSDGGVHSRYDQLLLCLQGAAEPTAATALVPASGPICACDSAAMPCPVSSAVTHLRHAVHSTMTSDTR
jgi:BPG-independent PGAM N-terminus (iPGM_N)